MKNTQYRPAILSWQLIHQTTADGIHHNYKMSICSSYLAGYLLQNIVSFDSSWRHHSKAAADTCCYLRNQDNMNDPHFQSMDKCYQQEVEWVLILVMMKHLD